MNGILLVDDSAFMRRWYRKVLEGVGLKIAGEAGNGFEAVVRYEELRPELVLLDISMPGLSGVDALKEILRADRNAKVVISSAMGQEIFVRQCMGAKAFLVKPITERILLDALRRLCGEEYFLTPRY